jgi:dephospho-CoA kinase
MGTPLRIGLTGGIASGKSAAAAAFARRGVPVIDADVIAREVVEPGTPALAAVVDAFGTGILQPDGRLDRRRLRALVFADAAERRRLEAILHPAIRAESAARVAAARSPYVVLAIPLLAETGGRERVDRVLVVDCPEALQLARLLERDGETPAQAAAILAAQASRADRLALADDRIDNSGSLAALDAAVGALHARYLVLAAGADGPGAGGRNPG